MRGRTPSTLLLKNRIFAWATWRGGACRSNRARRRGRDFASKAKGAAHQQFAKMKIPTAEKSENDLVVFGGENWRQHRTSVRLAHATMCISREDLIKFHAEVDHEHADQLMANFFETGEFSGSRVIEAAKSVTQG
jgi:hypothetical protein